MAKQQAHGISILTDGEYRRLNFQDSFVESVAGFIAQKQTIQFQESRTVAGEALQRWVPDSGKTLTLLTVVIPTGARNPLVPNTPRTQKQILRRYAPQDDGRDRTSLQNRSVSILNPKTTATEDYDVLLTVLHYSDSSSQERVPLPSGGSSN